PGPAGASVQSPRVGVARSPSRPFFLFRPRRPPRHTLFPTRRSSDLKPINTLGAMVRTWAPPNENQTDLLVNRAAQNIGFHPNQPDRKSTRLNSSHDQISYAVFCLKKKKHARLPHAVAGRPHPGPTRA